MDYKTIDKTNGTSRDSSCFFSIPTTLMLVFIWMGGIGFRISQKRSAEMLVITTFTLSMIGQKRIIAVGRFKTAYFCL